MRTGELSSDQFSYRITNKNRSGCIGRVETSVSKNSTDKKYLTTRGVVYQMMEAIILAAGFSRRMKQNKLLLPLSRATVIENTVMNCLCTGIDGVTVVLGNEKEKVRQVLEQYPVHFIENPRYAEGMSSSIQEGIKILIRDQKMDGVMILPGDMPFIKPETINYLVENFQKNPGSIIIPVFQDRKGHPIFFNKSLFPNILNIPEDMGLREVIKENIEKVLYVDVSDQGILIDLDRPEDYAYWHSKELREV